MSEASMEGGREVPPLAMLPSLPPSMCHVPSLPSLPRNNHARHVCLARGRIARSGPGVTAAAVAGMQGGRKEGWIEHKSSEVHIHMQRM